MTSTICWIYIQTTTVAPLGSKTKLKIFRKLEKIDNKSGRKRQKWQKMSGMLTTATLYIEIAITITHNPKNNDEYLDGLVLFLISLSSGLLDILDATDAFGVPNGLDISDVLGVPDVSQNTQHPSRFLTIFFNFFSIPKL